MDKAGLKTNPAARIERKSFFVATNVQLNGKRLQKRLGVEGGNSCHNNSH